MKQFEYKIDDNIPSGPIDTWEAQFNKLGKDGWQLCASLCGALAVLVFQREKVTATPCSSSPPNDHEVKSKIQGYDHRMFILDDPLYGLVKKMGDG